MANSKIVLITALYVVVFIILTNGNAWTLSSYAQKYGMGCKSCHTFGSNLNELGLTFKKNGHNFGENNAAQKDKSKQVAPRDDKNTNSETSGKSPDKSELKTGDTKAVSEPPDADQPLPETKVYSWKADDGTLHFSDTPYVKQRGGKKAALDTAEKKIVRSGFKPLSAMIPKLRKKTAARTATAGPEKVVLTKTGSPGSLDMSQIEIKAEASPKSFEDCMEQILVANPSPNTSEAAMGLFQEAETICAPYENKQQR